LDGSIYTGVVGPHATLTELDLDLSTWDLQFLSLADRRPIRVQMMWRQQSDGIDSIVRTSEVYFRPPHDAPDGPFEQHDLSEFVCSERHIAKVGAYLVAHRALVHHTLKVDAIPGDYNTSVADGMIVRVTVPRAVDGQTTSTHDYLYRVVSIEKDLGGTTVFNLVHFPLDSQGRSALSMAVMGANPSGLVLPIAKTGPVCDVNDSTDTTDLPDDGILWNLPTDPTFGIPIDPPDLPDLPDLPDPPIPPDPPMPPMPPDPPGPPMPPDPPGPDAPPPGQPGQPIQPSQPNEGQPNPDKKPPSGTPPSPTTPPTAPPVTPLPPQGGPWGPLGPPAPGMPLYDISWEAQVDRYSTAFTNSEGKIEKPASSATPALDWMYYEVRQVHTWVYFQFVSQKYNYAPEYKMIKQARVVGILGINYNEKAQNNPALPVDNTFNGYQLKPGGSYQGGGHSAAPTFTNGTNVYYARIRNFRIRLSGTQNWQPANEGPGQDADTL
jgi:hypothetical protein